jgi:hypothetical protein
MSSLDSYQSALLMSQYVQSDKILRKALEGIVTVLGPVGESAIISELKLKCDYDEEYLDRNVVADCFQHLFGADSAGLLLEMIDRVEDRLEAKIAELSLKKP